MILNYVFRGGGRGGARSNDGRDLISAITGHLRAKEPFRVENDRDRHRDRDEVIVLGDSCRLRLGPRRGF